MKGTTILTLAVIAALSFTSCKKDRTCECTFSTVSQTSTQPGYTFTPPPPQTTSTKYSKVKKNHNGIKYCTSSETTNNYQTSVYNSQTQTYTYYDVVRVTKNDCKIK